MAEEVGTVGTGAAQEGGDNRSGPWLSLRQLQASSVEDAEISGATERIFLNSLSTFLTQNVLGQPIPTQSYAGKRKQKTVSSHAWTADFAKVGFDDSTWYFKKEFFRSSPNLSVDPRL